MCCSPAATDANPLPTCLGSYRSVVVPSPSWPWAFWPQVQSVPSGRTPTEWASPPATCRHTERQRTETLVTSPRPTVPAPEVTAQSCTGFEGCRATVTE